MSVARLGVLILCVYSVTSFSLRNNNRTLFELSVVHLNDFHARFEEVSKNAGICKGENCIGGFSRVFAVTHKLLTERPNSIFLNAGDNFQGTLWYNVFKWNATQYFLNMIPTDALTLGNHEFDDKIQGAIPFLEHIKAPVVVANIDDSLEPELHGLYNKSVIIERGGKRIGVIGVIFAKTNEISSTEKLKFLDESKSVNMEAERLVREENVFTIIVLSHCGYEIDIQIAKKASPKIGLIVGGHSHSFLFTGDKLPGPDKPIGPYPTVVNHTDGRKILITQAAAFTKYLGNITVFYDEKGNVDSWSGAPIYLDTNVPQDPNINNLLLPWKEKVDAKGNELLGETKVILDNKSCRYTECTLGNFVTDAMVYHYLDKAEPGSWTYAAIAITNVGGLRAPIEKGNITYNDMIAAQPFENTLDVGELSGKHVKEFLEFAVTPYSRENSHYSINLLQVSGIHVSYDLNRPIGSRIVSLKLRCRECDFPHYEPLDLKKKYRVIVPSFVYGGGDGYKIFEEHMQNHQVGDRDIDAYVRYIKKETPITQELEGRIKIKGDGSYDIEEWK